MKSKDTFWDGIAVSYANRPISDMAAYEQTLERVVSHLTPQARVLELGCGTGSTALRLAPHAANILATDFSAGMIAQAEAREGADNVQFLRADVFDAGLDAGGFDIVMGFNLLHLIEDVPSTLARIHSLLAPGGLFISKTPCLAEPSLGWKFSLLKRLIPVMQWIGKAPYVKFESIAGLDRQVEAAGFRIIETGNYPVRPPNHFVVAERA
ncbi:class I SAM-dependent methyltransferase [Tateyamaria pelophila]|uniref:class I SAM-dependent methyltransferase n=1 Tax=Tateyamaria pelophila TaxID=328415 RepID=UPI001CBF2710|nr:class I SAM-dependent methyltransferase [Tateyamaria pelophila]